MSSPEPYSFTQHLREIVQPRLKALEFRRKGTKFLRKRDEYTEVIYFQRSPMNIPEAESTFYLNVGLETDRKFVSAYGRIHHGSAPASEAWNYSNETQLRKHFAAATAELERIAPAFFSQLQGEFDTLQTVTDTMQTCNTILCTLQPHRS